jgi:hypothetical protein
MHKCIGATQNMKPKEETGGWGVDTSLTRERELSEEATLFLGAMNGAKKTDSSLGLRLSHLWRSWWEVKGKWEAELHCEQTVLCW